VDADDTAFLVRQAALPANGEPSPDGERRDYVRLARLVGYAPEVYSTLSPDRVRTVDSAVDEELARRQESLGRVLGSAEAAADRDEGHGSGPSSYARPRAEREAPSDTERVWADIREVEAGRKRQLGLDYD
jgi:hypothetical protein